MDATEPTVPHTKPHRIKILMQAFVLLLVGVFWARGTYVVFHFWAYLAWGQPSLIGGVVMHTICLIYIGLFVLAGLLVSGCLIMKSIKCFVLAMDRKN